MAQDEISEALLKVGQHALQQVDPSAYLVWPRIIRRLILLDRDLTGIAWNVPHRKSYLVTRERLLAHVAPDELGVEQAQTIPDHVILISRPDRDDLCDITEPALLRYLWQMLYHARVHRELSQRRRGGQLTAAQVRARIDRIGQTEFDEIRTVLRRENFLFPAAGNADVYEEFVAVYCEMRQFNPGWLSSYFPSLHDLEAIDAVVREDVPFEELTEITRPVGAGPASATPSTQPTGHGLNLADLVHKAATTPPETRRAVRMVDSSIKRADRLAAQGNSVRAAILRIQAAQYASAANEATLIEQADAEVSRLTKRLQAALQFDDVEATQWQASLKQLVRNSMSGFWNNDARLLFDLQKVCVDHERQVSVVDLVGWVWSFGRQSLKRPLPNQREVLMSKHLRSATARLPVTSLTPEERDALSHLLHDAAESAEEQLRHRLRPLLATALERVGLASHNLPEQVARRKIIEELSDVVVERGFLTMGNLRDAISRNNLKVADLRTLKEVLQGDQLLRADREFSRLLDGVYNPGEFYMRWLQRLSSLAFGTQAGRFVTKFLLIPFGSSVVILEGLDHLVHLVAGFFLDESEVQHAEEHGLHGSEILTQPVPPVGSTEGAVPPLPPGTDLTEPVGPAAVAADATAAVHEAAVHAHARYFMAWDTFLALGLFILALMHVPPFRRGVLELLRLVWKFLRLVLYDTPRWCLKQPIVQNILHSQPVHLFRRYLLLPLLVTGVISSLTLALHTSWRDWWIGNGVIALALTVVLNSRLGRDLEEVSSEYVLRLVHRIGVQFFLALFELIMDTFKQILEFIERLLYAVDEWLRFKSGESDLTLIFKAILGVIWGAVTFVVRFCVNLLIEPQVNPIKHFPVVTVSHKIMITTILQPLASLLHHWGNFSLAFAGSLATIIVFLLPGAAGFIVWELKENWRLFVANRSRRLFPVLVGSHGETLIRLMKPGLHSGTLPKLFGKLRKAERKAHLPRWKNAKAIYLERIHHVEESIRHFFEREFCVLLEESRGGSGLTLTVGHVEAASNSLRIEIHCDQLSGDPLKLTFEEQSGWLLASVTNPGWIDNLTREQFTCLQLALAGIYKLGGVDLIREQITSLFAPRRLRYDISDQGIVVWPNHNYEVEVRYQLKERRLISPRPRRVAREYELPELDARAVLYSLNPIAWRRWVEAWAAERDQIPIPLLFVERVHLLPNEHSTLI